MKLSLFSIIYLFVRIIPMIIFFYFIYQYLITFDINTFYFLLGLFITFIIAFIIGNTPIIEKYKSLDIDTKVSNYCNVLLLTKNGPLSTIPLSQTMFSYALFFIFYIIFKYNIIRQNIQHLILFPSFMILDMVWNIQNNCINTSFILLAIVIGGICGLFFAYKIDKNKKIDLTKFMQMNRHTDNCKFNSEANKYICYGSPDNYDDIMHYINSPPISTKK